MLLHFLYRTGITEASRQSELAEAGSSLSAQCKGLWHVGKLCAAARAAKSEPARLNCSPSRQCSHSKCAAPSMLLKKLLLLHFNLFSMSLSKKHSYLCLVRLRKRCLVRWHEAVQEAVRPRSSAVVRLGDERWRFSASSGLGTQLRQPFSSKASAPCNG